MTTTLHDARDYADWIENHTDPILECREHMTGELHHLCRQCLQRRPEAYHVMGQVVAEYCGEMVTCQNELTGCCERRVEV